MKVYTCDTVKLDWLVESVEAKKRLPEEDYLFETKKKNDKTDDKKDDESSVDDKKNSKKSKKSDKEDKAPKKRTLEEVLNEEHDGHPEKKQKDGQVAKSKDVKVDVDMGCHLRGESAVCLGRSSIY